ncbi:hypothetical protein GOBAR_DD12206 [Gossypium barbadense]|nr:hypothetical protein GOBAR_DD12206 [Gossypium barbadense]
MKITYWRYINNYLPTKANLYQSKIRIDRMCPRNGSGPGTTLRVCQDCSSILEVWHRLGIIWTPAPEVEDTPIRWISQLFANNERQGRSAFGRTTYLVLCLRKLWPVCGLSDFPGIWTFTAVLISKLQCAATDRSPVSAFVWDAKQLVVGFERFKFQHIKR